jgi:ABC-type dipeptide/oligopeptide/nickel transport system permease subunit
MQQEWSFSRQTWRRLKKNKGALFGLVIIVLTALAATFCYLIAPDDSPNADFQTVEIQAKGPGYEQLFLKVPAGILKTQTWFNTLLSGRRDDNPYLPITGYSTRGDTLLVNKFIDEDTAVQQVFSINRLTNNRPANLGDHFVTRRYWLGTDKFGRDILSRLLIGSRVSLSVGLIAVLISLTLGITLGALAGYYRGRVDEVVMWLVNVTWSIPTLLLVFAITMAMGKGFFQIFVAVGLTLWISVARLVRGQVIAIRELEYIQAAKTMGAKDIRIILRHILPNISGPVMVIAAGNFATAIMIEAGLSFLGIGVQPPQPSWGLMVRENYNFIITHHALLALIPGFAIMLLVLAFNLLGNGLRDAMDVKAN